MTQGLLCKVAATLNVLLAQKQSVQLILKHLPTFKEQTAALELIIMSKKCTCRMPSDLLLGVADVFHLSNESSLALVQGLLQLIKCVTDLRHRLVFPVGELLRDPSYEFNGCCELR